MGSGTTAPGYDRGNMMTSANFRLVKLCAILGTSALALSPAFASAAEPAADAATTAAVADAAAEPEIIVSGQREAQKESIEAKRQSFTVMDAISSDDIGKLPDHNSAAALRRIPGVSVQEDQGEPRFPVLRGLQSTYNRTTVDGAIVASVDDNGRTVPMDIIPSVMVGRLEVIKTVTPADDANAIGGVINVVTRSAFDAKEPFINALASYGVYEQNGKVRNNKPSFRLGMAGGMTFGADDEWGIVLGASHEQLDYDIPQVESAAPSVREYTAAGAPVNSGAATGNGIQVPTQLRLFWYNNTKQRTGANAKLEWRPTDSFRWEVSGLYTRTEDDEERIEFRTEPLGNVTAQTATSGTFARGRNIIHINQPITQRRIWQARTAFAWTPSAQWKIDGDAVYSRGQLRVPNTSIEFRTRDASGGNYGFNYDTTNFFPVFTPLNAAANRAPQNYFLQQQRDQLLTTKDSTAQFRFNAGYDDGGVDRNLQIKTGGVVRLGDRNYSNASTSYTAATGFTYTLDAVDRAGPDTLIQGLYQLTPRIDVAQAMSFFDANKASFVTAVAARSGDYALSEDVYAGYLQASLRIDTLTLLAGMRYEHTRVSSDGQRSVAAGLVPAHNEGSYGNWLPGVHLRWNVTPQLVLRAAWTNTIGRPDYASLAATENLRFDGTVPTLSLGNPGLKPRKSRGFDLSLEFYPKDGVISIAAFSKDISNEIFTLSAVERRDVGRGVEDVLVSTPRNAETARIRGLELGMQQAFTFLPAPFDGLGISANATILDTRFTFLTTAGPRVTGLFLQPDLTTNASIYYQKGKFEARLSHNYIGGFLETINDTIPNADQYWKGRHTFDANISYRVMPQVTLFAEGQNLSDAGRREVTGPGRTYLQEAAEYGRTFWIGAAVKF